MAATATPSANRGGIVASLCDSRTCNQSGGGEHIKTDMEDFLALMPNNHDCTPHYKVNFTTCLGMCNRSPNLVLKSKSGGLVIPNHNNSNSSSKLVNDGGLRMRVEEDSDSDDTSSTKSEVAVPTTNANINSSATCTSSSSNNNNNNYMHSRQQVLVIHEVSIPKLARAVGMDTLSSNLVRASDCQVRGKRWLLREKEYEKAWELFEEGRVCCEEEESIQLRTVEEQEQDPTANHGSMHQQLLKSSRQLQASLRCWGSTCRLKQWVNERETGTGSLELVQSAALGAFRVITMELQYSGYVLATNSSNTTVEEMALDADSIHGLLRHLIHSLVHCTAGKETVSMIPHQNFIIKVDERDGIVRYSSDTVNDHLSPPSSTTTVSEKVLLQCMIALADAWSHLANQDNQKNQVWMEGALMAYRAVLTVTTHTAAANLRLLRAKERRCIQAAISKLSTAY